MMFLKGGWGGIGQKPGDTVSSKGKESVPGKTSQELAIKHYGQRGGGEGK